MFACMEETKKKRRQEGREEERGKGIPAPRTVFLP